LDRPAARGADKTCGWGKNRGATAGAEKIMPVTANSVITLFLIGNRYLRLLRGFRHKFFVSIWQLFLIAMLGMKMCRQFRDRRLPVIAACLPPFFRWFVSLVCLIWRRIANRMYDNWYKKILSVLRFVSWLCFWQRG
jgi:hypothetical protein